VFPSFFWICIILFSQCFIGKHETVHGRRNAGTNNFGLKRSRDLISPFPGWSP